MSPRHRIFVSKDVLKFSSAHMTVFPDGSKERLHGHNFQVLLEFELYTTQLASLLDFGVVKQTLAQACQAWDQRLLLGTRCPAFELIRQEGGELEFKLCGKRYVVPEDEAVLLPLENVVVETLAEELAFVLVDRLGSHLKRDVVAAMTVTVSESTGQGGSYRWDWNPRAA
jgi:6-pyruvoyltetrahydropterin/6-carboxytetrahydropterin synthase